jgi:hypothetical protein
MENEELIKAAERHTKITIPSDYHSFIKGAKWQAERMYSEDEVIVLIEKALTHNDYELCGSLVTKDSEIRTANFGVWFEQFKKKVL